MNDNRLAGRNSPEALQDAVAFRHRNEDRRKLPSKGFTRIPVVGWICRRERCRRKDDKPDIGAPYGGKMQEKIEKREIERVAPRIATEAAITCRPFASCGDAHSIDAVMRNFSEKGSYIETSSEFKLGTILQMRVVDYPPMLPSTTGQAQPPSICLAEVKWRQDMADENATRYGIGLRYLD